MEIDRCLWKNLSRLYKPRREGEEPRLDLKSAQRENEKVLQEENSLKNFMTKRRKLRRKEKKLEEEKTGMENLTYKQKK